MKPEVLGFGFLAFCFFLGLHIVLWRARRPKNDVLVLFLLLLVIPAAITAGLLLATVLGATFGTWNRLDFAAALLLHLSFALVYIASYPAAQAHSPSLAIILLIAASAGKRLTAEEITRLYTTEHTMVKRVEDLEIYGVVTRRNGAFVLNGRGRMIIRAYRLYRRLLGMRLGEG